MREARRAPQGRAFPLFILIDLAVFLALIVAYVYARVHTSAWPRPFHFPSGLMTVAMVMSLVASSFTVRIAAHSARRRDTAMTQRMLAVSLVGWGTYLFLLAIEWARLFLAERVTLLENRWGVPALGLTYYGITGFHAAQVVAGCVWMLFAATATDRWKPRALVLFVDFVNALFVVIAFFVILSAADLNGF